MFHQIYDGKTRLRHYLCAFRSRYAGCVSGKFQHGHLHAQANAQEGNAVLSGVFACKYFAIHSARTKTGGYQDAFHTGQFLFDVLFAQVFTLYGKYFYAGAVGRSGVDERLQNGFVGILQFHVFAHERYVHFLRGVVDPMDKVFPGIQIGFYLVVQFQEVHQDAVQILTLQIERDFVDALLVYGFYDGVRAYVAKKRYFSPER